jgi:hypothetical protein
MTSCCAKSIFKKKLPLRLLIFLQAIFIAASAGAEPTSIYYSKFYVQTTNGIITDSGLEMLPARSEFRMEEFNCFQLTGEISGNTQLDALSEAKHNAISKILVAHGLKSVKSRRVLINSEAQDRTILNYEGVVRIPCRVLEEDFSKNYTNPGVSMEVWFAPMAFPSEWSSLYWKTVIKNAFLSVPYFFK